MGGLEENLAVEANGFLAAGADFGGALRELFRDGAKLGDVEELEGTTAEGGADVDVGAVVEDGFFCFDVGALGYGFDVGADFGEGDIEGRGVERDVVEVVESKLDFLQFCFRVWQGAVDDTCLEVWSEEAGVEDEEGDEGGDTELAHLQDIVAGVLGLVEFELSPVGFEADGAAGFIGNPIEVGEAPELV